MTDNQKLAACYDLGAHVVMALIFGAGVLVTATLAETVICALGLFGSIFYLNHVPLFLTACEEGSPAANLKQWACKISSLSAYVLLLLLVLTVTYGMFK